VVMRCGRQCARLPAILVRLQSIDQINHRPD